MKIYDTNLCKFDCLAIKTCLLLYMYLNVEQVKTRPLVLMLEQLICNMSDVTLFGKQLRLLKKSSNSTVTKSMVSMMACLTSDYHHFQGNLLTGIDKKPVRREGIKRFLLLFFSHTAQRCIFPVSFPVDLLLWQSVMPLAGGQGGL
jgi:hypothetical protein